MPKVIAQRLRHAIAAVTLTPRERAAVDDALLLAEAVTAAEQQFHRLGEGTATGLLVCDAKWRILYTNASATALLSATPTEMLGSALAEWIGAAPFSDLEARHGRVLHSPSSLAFELIELRFEGTNDPAYLINVWREKEPISNGAAPLRFLLPESIGDKLSPRERAVIELLVRSGDVAGTAKALHISRHTVRNHLKNSYAKLGVHSESDLLRLVLQASNSGESD